MLLVMFFSLHNYFSFIRPIVSVCVAFIFHLIITKFTLYPLLDNWRRGVVVSVVRRMNEVTLRRTRLVLGWVTVFWAGIPSRYVNSQLGQLSLASLRGVAKSSTSFGWGKGWNVTSAGWQVTLTCDPIWHVSFSSGVATSVSELLYTVLLYFRPTLLYFSRFTE